MFTLTIVWKFAEFNKSKKINKTKTKSKTFIFLSLQLFNLMWRTLWRFSPCDTQGWRGRHVDRARGAHSVAPTHYLRGNKGVTSLIKFNWFDTRLLRKDHKHSSDALEGKKRDPSFELSLFFIFLLFIYPPPQKKKKNQWTVLLALCCDQWVFLLSPLKRDTSRLATNHGTHTWCHFWHQQEALPKPVLTSWSILIFTTVRICKN